MRRTAKAKSQHVSAASLAADGAACMWPPVALVISATTPTAQEGALEQAWAPECPQLVASTACEVAQPPCYACCGTELAPPERRRTWLLHTAVPLFDLVSCIVSIAACFSLMAERGLVQGAKGTSKVTKLAAQNWATFVPAVASSPFHPAIQHIGCPLLRRLAATQTLTARRWPAARRSHG